MEPLLTLEQLAATLGLSVQTLYNRRARGESLPPCVKLGSRLRFFQTDVRAWLDAQRDGGGNCQAAPSREPGQTNHPAGLSEISCLRHNMHSRSVYASQDEDPAGGVARDPGRTA